MSKLNVQQVLRLLDDDSDSDNMSGLIESGAENIEEMLTVHIYNADQLPLPFVEEMVEADTGFLMELDVNESESQTNTTHTIRDMDTNTVIDSIPSSIGAEETNLPVCQLNVTNDVTNDDAVSSALCDTISVTISDTLNEDVTYSELIEMPDCNTDDVSISTSTLGGITQHNVSNNYSSITIHDICTLNADTETTDATMPQADAPRSRKKLKDITSWKKSIRKRRRQAGEEYINFAGKTVAKKQIKFKKDCTGKCRYKCGHIFTNNDIASIHKEFWSLTDNSKYIFFAKTTERNTHEGKKENARRKYTYSYYFYKDEQKIKVCKEFYFGVIQVDECRVRNMYAKMATGKGKEYEDMRGKCTKQRTPEAAMNFVRAHISSYPRMPSHYCRATTKKEYLEPGLSLAVMYDMYKVECAKKDLTPLKISMYRKLFNTEYNISFYQPKKDRCDQCEHMKKSKDNNLADEQLERKYNEHVSDKMCTKSERELDRSEKNQAVICFDLENVISLPRAEVKKNFYRRKLNSYNLTAHCSIDKGAYNAIWNEAEAGRGANEIASALVTILCAIRQKHPDIRSYILWSDSCVPQNRNSVMCYALKRFMLDNDVNVITQKFCCPGHSSIQEVDSIHSSIEKVLKVKEVYSPISLIRVLKNVRRTAPFNIIQMQKHHFVDYQNAIASLKFSTIPFTKVKCLRYHKEKQLDVEFKLSFEENEFRHALIFGKQMTRSSGPCETLPPTKPLKKVPVLSMEKRNDLVKMLDYMCDIDKQYYKSIKVTATPQESADSEPPIKRRKTN